MSAKKNSQPANPVTPPPAAAPSGVATVTTEPSWIESADPRRRLIAKIAYVVIWLYVAALCLLALDQWFNWGLFGPKIPPVP